MKAFLIGLVIVFAGCASRPPAVQSRRIVLPSGAPGYSISCANAQSINACYEVAGDVCLFGYDVVQQESSDGLVGGGDRVGNVASSRISTTWQKGLVIECKRDAEVMAARAEQREAHRRESVDMARSRERGIKVMGASIVGVFLVLAIASIF